jgi:hypothetical protein
MSDKRAPLWHVNWLSCRRPFGTVRQPEECRRQSCGPTSSLSLSSQVQELLRCDGAYLRHGV